MLRRCCTHLELTRGSHCFLTVGTHVLSRCCTHLELTQGSHSFLTVGTYVLWDLVAQQVVHSPWVDSGFAQLSYSRDTRVVGPGGPAGGASTPSSTGSTFRTRHTSPVSHLAIKDHIQYPLSGCILFHRLRVQLYKSESESNSDERAEKDRRKILLSHLV